MKITIFTLLLIALTLDVFSQDTDKPKEIEKKTYHTAFTKTPPEIDGYMNDECWNLVEWGGNFTQTTPYENQAPTQQSAFKILYDNNNLYVFICAYDTEVDKVRRILSRRDDFEGDFVEINIDSYFDKQTAFSFSAMASGSKGDEAVSLNGDNWDDSWNPIWFLKTSIDEKGWYAEMKIPLTQLRFGKKDEQIWGLQVMRNLYRDQERSHWQFIPKGSPGLVHLFGELHGIKNIEPKRQVEILPYLLAKTETFEKEEGNPFATGKKNGMSAGLDGKIGITNDFTLDFTVNPDFGQVEADPSEVNLSAFETYFSEQRPFFVEGKSIYKFRPANPIVINDFGSDNLFYSRRIGRYPQYYPDTEDGEYVKMPEATSILSALKLSGKTKKGMSVGVMESLTANEKAEIDHNGERRKESVEPLTNYFVGRLQQDFKKGETVLGVIVTAVNRDITNPAMNYLLTSAYSGGFDFQHNWKERTWYVAANGTFSKIMGSEEALIRTQRSSAHYFQRPDATHLSLDSTLTSLDGYSASFKFGKNSKKRISFQTSVSLKSPGLEFNDVGYMKSSDMIHHGTWMGYYMREPFSIFRNFYLNLNYWLYWDFGGTLLSANANMNFNTQFKSKWQINGSVARKNENISPTLLRGGQSFIKPGNTSFDLSLNSDYSKKVAFYLGNFHNFGDEHYFRYHQYWAGIEIRPMNSMSISISGSYVDHYNQLQYVKRVVFKDESRYILAQIEQQEVSLTFRLNYTITPELSIQYYGQPFISSGKYVDLKRSTQDHATNYNDRFYTFAPTEYTYNTETEKYDFDENLDGTTDYSISKPDYNFLQFRSNMVVRWEFRPGSTAYLVWSQGKTGNDSNGNFRYGDNMKSLFKEQPHNVFLLKFNYWFSL